MWASQYGHDATCKLLLEHGAGAREDDDKVRSKLLQEADVVAKDNNVRPRRPH